MKTPRSFSRRALAPQLRARQGGTILIIALIVLVAMTLAGIATMRSVDTATITAGNIGLRQASVNAADQGIQSGVNWLIANLGPTLINDNHQPGTASKGYFSSVAANDPDWYDPANWSEAAQLNNGNPDAGGNVVFFLIHRMCAIPNCDSSATCAQRLPVRADPDAERRDDTTSRQRHAAPVHSGASNAARSTPGTLTQR